MLAEVVIILGIVPQVKCAAANADNAVILL